MAGTESDKVYEFLHGIQLEQFYRQIVDQLHVTRLNHFAHVTEQDLNSLGLSKPEQRRLFEALKKSKKKLLFGSFRRKKSKTKLFSSEPDNDEPSRPSLPLAFKPADPPSPPQSSPSLTCVIDEKDLVLREMLGTGAFGYVRKGEWLAEKNTKIDVAVKCLKISKDSAFLQLQMDFTKEANGMRRLDHPHIIKLYGVVLSTPIMLVTELAPLGCLLTCLRDENPKFLISQLCDFVVQVASGMAYLEAEHYIHRDLAARNLLLSSRDTVKIGDFGLMRPLDTDDDYYTMNPKGKVPFAWCPPESLKFRKFSHASDMWSFGILLMELFSYGEDPWPGLSCTEILQKVDMPKAERPQKPSHCPSKIYNVVLNHCWAHEPAHRPTFAAIQNIMEQIRPEDVKAKRTFESQTPQNLPFIEGDDITLIEASADAAWWRGQNKRTGRVGMFPSEMVDSPSSSLPTTVVRSDSITKRVANSPIACTPDKCDCGEDHFYDFPYIMNSQNKPTSPTHSMNSDLTCSTESGYSSSFTPSIADSFRRDSNTTYENCIGSSNYELMEPKVRTKPTRQIPSPYEYKNVVRQDGLDSHVNNVDFSSDQGEKLNFGENLHVDRQDLRSIGSAPVSIPERKDSLLDKRFSDPIAQDAVIERLSGVTTPHENTTTKRLSGESTAQGNSPKRLSDSASITSQEDTPKLVPENAFIDDTTTKRLSGETSAQGTAEKRLSGDATPENSPTSVRDNKTSQEDTQKRIDKPRTSGPFMLSRRVSARKLKSFDIPLRRSDSLNSPTTSDGRNSPSNLESPSSSRPNSRTGMGSMSPDSPVPRPKSQISEDSPRVHPRAASFTRSCSSDAFSSKSLKEARQRIKSPSPTELRDLQQRDTPPYSAEEASPQVVNSTDITSRLGRSYSFGTPSSSSRECERHELYENHEYIPRCNTVSGTTTALDNRPSQRGTVYENYEMMKAMDIAQRLISSENNMTKEEAVGAYDNHKLQSGFNSSGKVPSSSAQGYEKMVLRKSYIENDRNSSDSASRNINPRSASYENYSAGAIKNSKVSYENFVMVEHSDVPEEIGSIHNTLKCPSYENHGFEELRAQAENEMKETDLLDNVFQEYSSSVPNSDNWQVIRKTLDDNGSLVIKMGRSVTPRLRRSSSDGDLRDDAEKDSCATSSYGTDDMRNVRCSLDITGKLASALSDRINIKEHVMITNGDVKIVDAQMETTFRSPKESSDSVLRDKHLVSKDLGNRNKLVHDGDFCELYRKNRDLDSLNDCAQADLSLRSIAASGIVPKDIPPALPVRNQHSLKSTTNNEYVRGSYENVKKGTPLPQRAEQAVATQPLLENNTSSVEETNSTQPTTNVISFENKLVSFMSPRLLKKEKVEDVPELPPKARSLPRQQKSTSNYPRLSRDSSDVKLNFVEDVNRYRPCPSKGSPNYEYPRRNVSNDDVETPPPLPKKMSKNNADIAA